MSFFVKAASCAARLTPASTPRSTARTIVFTSYQDLGIAVGTAAAWSCPCSATRNGSVRRDREARSPSSPAGRATDKLTIDELAGGTFTITNGGIYGSLMSTPILNPPQTGMLGMHNIQNRAVVGDGQVVIRPMMYVALTYDHRVVDGREAVTFLRRIKEVVEEPARLLLES